MLQFSYNRIVFVEKWSNKPARFVVFVGFVEKLAWIRDSRIRDSRIRDSCFSSSI